MNRYRCVGNIIALLVLTSLTACWPGPNRLDFATDGRILRGTYEGTGTMVGVDVPSEDQTLHIRMDVIPTYTDQKGYAVAGTLTLGQGDPLPFQGRVSGGDTEIYVLTTPPRPVRFEIRFDYKGESWRLEGSDGGEDGGGRREPWYVLFGPAPDAYSSGYYQATLVPVQ